MGWFDQRHSRDTVITPKYPEIEGLDDFRSPMFHTARWDHDVSIEGKKVGLIGTGSSGVQITAAVAPK